MFRHPIYRQRHIAHFARLLSFLDPVFDKRPSHNCFWTNPGQKFYTAPRKEHRHHHKAAADSGLAARRSMTL